MSNQMHKYVKLEFLIKTQIVYTILSLASKIAKLFDLLKSLEIANMRSTRSSREVHRCYFYCRYRYYQREFGAEGLLRCTIASLQQVRCCIPLGSTLSRTTTRGSSLFNK